MYNSSANVAPLDIATVTVALKSVNHSGNTITFACSPAVCAESFSGGSSFFFGLTSQYPPRDITATIQNSSDDDTINLAACAPPYLATIGKLVMWHAWPEGIRSMLKQHAEEHQIELVDFASEAELEETLRDPSTNPNLILGPDTWNDTLIETELASAYCYPMDAKNVLGLIHQIGVGTLMVILATTTIATSNWPDCTIQNSVQSITATNHQTGAGHHNGIVREYFCSHQMRKD